jgi:hypothetical protein
MSEMEDRESSPVLVAGLPDRMRTKANRLWLSSFLDDGLNYL